MALQIRLSVKQGVIPTPDVQLWRIPHDVERVNVDLKDFRYRPNVGMGGRGIVRKEIRDAGVARPEVYRCKNDHTTPIRSAHQWLWKNINPELSKQKWRSLLGNSLAWTNNTGFPGRADWVNMLELDQKLPTFHATIINGGMIVEGIEDGDVVWLKSLLTCDPVPNTDEFLKGHAWFWGTSVIPSNGTISVITRLGTDGTYKTIRVPFLTVEKVWLPKDELHKLGAGELPSVYWEFNS